jgi:hypothetical protein
MGKMREQLKSDIKRKHIEYLWRQGCSRSKITKLTGNSYAHVCLIVGQIESEDICTKTAKNEHIIET